MVPFLALFVAWNASFSEMIPDRMLIVRCILAFSFWCAVIGLSFPPTLGVEVLLKGLVFGILSSGIATLCQWTYQFAADGSWFEEPRYTSAHRCDKHAHLRRLVNDIRSNGP